MIYYIFHLLLKQSGKITLEKWPTTAMERPLQSQQPRLPTAFCNAPPAELTQKSEFGSLTSVIKSRHPNREK